MELNNFIEVTTERLTLRKLKQSDWSVISYLRSNKDVNEFVKRPSAESKEKALEFISKINSGIKNQSLYYWAITEKNKDLMIGSICLWNFSEDKKTTEVGYDLSPDYQGKGIMTESLKGILNFGFQNLKITAIKAYTHAKNESSKKLLINNGFTLVEGKKDEQNLNNVIYEIKKL